MSKKSVIISAVSALMLLPSSALAYSIWTGSYGEECRIGTLLAMTSYLFYIILLAGKDNLSKGEKVFYALLAIPVITTLSFIALTVLQFIAWQFNIYL
ncbi:hypothetical protein VU12_14260 [Desulfobulbus sp. US4]|nr:hypothetical protein [Desulfobulbus sp. US4]